MLPTEIQSQLGRVKILKSNLPLSGEPLNNPTTEGQEMAWNRPYRK